MGRTTLMLDEEAVVAARELARREHLSLGEGPCRDACGEGHGSLLRSGYRASASLPSWGVAPAGL